MFDTTYDAIKSILKGDASITTHERKQLLASLRNDPAKPSAPENPPSKARLVRRGEASFRLGISPRTFDRLCREGVFTKRFLPRRKRAAGILESDLVALLAQKEAGV